MSKRTDLVNAALADVLRGAYVTAKLTQPKLAEITGIVPRTLQRIMAGSAPVTMGQLEAIAKAVDRDPQELFEDALQKADRDEVSAAPPKPVSIDTERAKRDAAKMPEGELKGLKNAAKRKNPELGSDEPPTT